MSHYNGILKFIFCSKKNFFISLYEYSYLIKMADGILKLIFYSQKEKSLFIYD